MLFRSANLPIIHYSVQKWGGQHPKVISKGGGGLQHPDMKLALTLGFLTFTLLAITLVWQRARLHLFVGEPVGFGEPPQILEKTVDLRHGAIPLRADWMGVMVPVNSATFTPPLFA